MCRQADVLEQVLVGKRVMCAIAMLFCINAYNDESAKSHKRDLISHLECSDNMYIKGSVLVQCTMQVLSHACWSGCCSYEHQQTQKVCLVDSTSPSNRICGNGVVKLDYI